jgi:UDP-glucose 4-epimerase
MAKVQAAARKVDAIVHLAAQVSPYVSMQRPDITNATNVDGTLNVLRAAIAEKISKVVFASSSSVYGPAKARRVSEDSTTNPITPYGVSKLSGEKYCGAFCRAYGLPTISLRYFNVYGERQRSNPYSGVIAIFAKALTDGRSPTIFGDGYQTRDFIHVSDVARANLMALRRTTGLGRAFNIGTGKATSIRELFRLLGQVMGVVRIKPKFRAERPGDIRDSCADMSMTQSVLKYTPRIDLRTGLERLIQSLG